MKHQTIQFTPEEIVTFFLRRYNLTIRDAAISCYIHESTLAKKLKHSPIYARPRARAKVGYEPRQNSLEDHELQAILTYLKERSHGDLGFLTIDLLKNGRLELG